MHECSVNLDWEMFSNTIFWHTVRDFWPKISCRTHIFANMWFLLQRNEGAISDNLWRCSFGHPTFLWPIIDFKFACGCIFSPTAAVIAHWFKKRRGLAMGFVAVGSSIGGTVLPIVTKLLIPAIGLVFTPEKEDPYSPLIGLSGPYESSDSFC